MANIKKFKKGGLFAALAAGVAIAIGGIAAGAKAPLPVIAEETNIATEVTTTKEVDVTKVASADVKVEPVTQADPDEVGNPIVYYNDEVRNLEGDAKYNFGGDVYTASGNETLTYCVGTDGKSGDFFYKLRHDPALMAAETWVMSKTFTSIKFTYPDGYENLKEGRKPDALAEFYEGNFTAWSENYKLMKDYLKECKTEIITLDDYTSSMYMVPDGRGEGKPAVTVANTQYSNGHALTFTSNEGTVRFRLECGYQPLNVAEYVKIPATNYVVDDSVPTVPAKKTEPPKENPPTPEPPTPDPPTPEPPTPEPPTPEPPTPEPPTPEPPTPEPPTPEAKDPSVMPNPVTKDLPPEEGADFRNGPKNPNGNEENQTELTDEPESPTEYKAPEAPKSEPNEGNGNSETKQETPKPSSGSEIVDRDNGTTEQVTVTDDSGNQVTKEYEVQAGDGQNHTDLEEVQKNADESTVEKPLQEDGTNEGDLDESAVE